MIKYRIEEDNKYFIGSLEPDFSTYDDALRFLTYTLSEQSNYMYKCNKDNIYSIYKVDIKEDNDVVENIYLERLITLSVKEYKNMTREEREIKGLRY